MSNTLEFEFTGKRAKAAMHLLKMTPLGKTPLVNWLEMGDQVSVFVSHYSLLSKTEKALVGALIAMERREAWVPNREHLDDAAWTEGCKAMGMSV